MPDPGNVLIGVMGIVLWMFAAWRERHCDREIQRLTNNLDATSESLRQARKENRRLRQALQDSMQAANAANVRAAVAQRQRPPVWERMPFSAN